MNLFDIVKRRDRSLVVEAGTVETAHRSGPSGFLGVRLSPKAVIRLSRADEFACLSTFPRDVGWVLRGAQPHATITARKGIGSEVLFTSSDAGGSAQRVLLTWPASANASFDLEIANTGSEPLEIESSPYFNPRTAIAPLIQGVGIEVGPGDNPFVKPTEQIDVTYLEAYSAEEWQNMYHKNEKQLDWSKYALGDAHTLDGFDNRSLDFIFSSHVFEHLINPLGVLKNWSAKLRAGGVVTGVVPDLRYCFDLRHPPSTLNDWKEEYDESVWAPPLTKYEKWCKYTSPEATPASLIARKYSIHMHYYTPDSFRLLLQEAIGRGLFKKMFLNTSPNNKDFGFVAWS